MEIEKISNVNSNYKNTETVKVASVPVENSRVVTEMVERSADNAAKTVNIKGESGERGKEKKEHKPSEATIDDAVKSANRRMERTRCEYSYHKETNRVSIKVFDADTDEVIREIPPEKSLDMLQKMWEMAGILVDERR
ncbi:MAG: flagellar protein FlaG [Eubacterium sp.]|nr:flagellar protein FlaG [Eubacterium sp.]